MSWIWPLETYIKYFIYVLGVTPWRHGEAPAHARGRCFVIDLGDWLLIFDFHTFHIVFVVFEISFSQVQNIFCSI